MNDTIESDHSARPSDGNGPGDRCKDCGIHIVWVGPSASDWMHLQSTPECPAPPIVATEWFHLPETREKGITYDNGDEISDNFRRATGGAVGMRAYAVEAYNGGSGEPLHTILGDLLGDLMHLSDALEGVDFDRMLQRARNDYSYELRGQA